MPKALVIGIDNSIGSSVSSILGHERTVKSTFLSVAPESWEAEILMYTRNEYVADESDVVAIVNSGTQDCEGDYSANTTQKIIMCWVSQNIEDYDLVIFSYDVDGYYTSVLSDIINVYGKPLFMPMSNSSALASNYAHSNIVFNGGGETENIRGYGNKLWFWDETPSGSTLTSFTNATVAGKCASLLSDGLTTAQALRAMSNSSWTLTDGFGKPNNVETNALQPINGIRAFVSGEYVKIYYTVFYGDEIDSVNIYVDGELYTNDLGTAKSGYGWSYNGVPYYLQSSTFYELSYHASEFDSGERIFTIGAVKDASESAIRAYDAFTITIPSVPEPTPPDPTPEPPEPEPVPPEAPEPPTLSFSRTGDTVTVTIEEPLDSTVIVYKFTEAQYWTVIDEFEGSSSNFTVDPTKTYIFNGKVNEGDLQSDYTTNSYISGDEAGSIGVIF